MKISNVIFHIKLIPSHPWWECKNTATLMYREFRTKYIRIISYNNKRRYIYIYIYLSLIQWTAIDSQWLFTDGSSYKCFTENQWNSTDESVEASGRSNKTSNICVDESFELANSKVMFTWRIHWFLSEIKAGQWFMSWYIFTDIISDYFTDSGLESTY